MKNRFLVMIAALLMTMPILSAQLSDVEISAKRTTLDQSKARGNNTTTTTKEIAYELQIKNKTFHDIPALEIKYLVFYSDAQAGSKEDGVLKSVQGTESVTGLSAHDNITLQTKPISLSSEQLDGNWYYGSGASNRARDAVKGVWIRAYAEGKMVAEYMNPSTLDKKNDWKD